MNAMNRILGGAALALALAAGLATPALAQKLDNKNPPATTATTTGDIDFGDDSSQWAKDGECDDPRFTGAGSASELVDDDIMKDATDCRAAYEAGTVSFESQTEVNSADTDAAPRTVDDIAFGDDSSDWAKDGECDDPRFKGEGAAAEQLTEDVMKDATDCREAYEAGTVTLADGSDGSETPGVADIAIATPIDAIDFGDDSSEWAKDEECDDPRFTGTGSATELLDTDIMKDATDCRAAYEAGTVTFSDTAGDIDYGDDTSEWAKDGECDDPRFSGTGVADELLDTDIGRDATDCRAAVEASTATFNGGAATTPIAAFDYGSDWSEWANDGECDDLRFTGEGTDKKLLTEDIYGDASDCKALEAEGKVTIRTVYTPEYAAGAPYDSSDINFGDNTSDYADDDQCDDPRFEGPGAATTLLDSDLERDSADCKAAYEEGTIVLKEDA